MSTEKKPELPVKDNGFSSRKFLLAFVFATVFVFSALSMPDKPDTVYNIGLGLIGLYASFCGANSVEHVSKIRGAIKAIRGDGASDDGK